MVIEIFVADLVRNKQMLPGEILFTFTYPLRGTSDGSTQKYENAIGEALIRSKKDLGYELTLNNNKKWKLYSESHAAAEVTGPGHSLLIKLVADLGGGTLDTFISTTGADQKDERFKKVVTDSIRLGGDLLLDILAKEREKYLPKGQEKGWGDDEVKCMKNLRAWMRSMGAANLFAVRPTGLQAPGLGLRGFDDAKDSGEARELIERYFRLITDFLARSVVAYVVGDVWPKLTSKDEKKRLKVCIRLQGNGWRLWYDSSNYSEIQKIMSQWIEERTNQLWESANTLPELLHRKDRLWHEDTINNVHESPKSDPICGVIGEKSMDSGQVLKNSYKYTLCKIWLRREGKEDAYEEWYDPIPLRDAKDAKLEVMKFDPALCIHSLRDPREAIEIIGNKRMRTINGMIEREKTSDNKGVHVPIAAIIWENVFQSIEFKE